MHIIIICILIAASSDHNELIAAILGVSAPKKGVKVWISKNPFHQSEMTPWATFLPNFSFLAPSDT